MGLERLLGIERKAAMRTLFLIFTIALNASWLEADSLILQNGQTLEGVFLGVIAEAYDLQLAIRYVLLVSARSKPSSLEAYRRPRPALRCPWLRRVRPLVLAQSQPVRKSRCV